MEAGDRDAVVNEFREGVTKILIATDVLSRGFDVSQVGCALVLQEVAHDTILQVTLVLNTCTPHTTQHTRHIYNTQHTTHTLR